MVVYFRKYIFAICAIAVALPIVASTIYPLITGRLMASSVSGLIGEFLLFILGFLIGYRIFSKKAQDDVEQMIDLYNVSCDPKGFIARSKPIYESMTYPCNEQAAWLLGSLGQAFLDIGDIDQAKKIEEGLLKSADNAKDPSASASIISYLVPLDEKLSGAQSALTLIEKGSNKIADSTNPQDSELRRYFDSQKQIIECDVSGDAEKVIAQDSKIMSDDRYPMRVRVEYAFNAAKNANRVGDTTEEDGFLRFVIKNGGSLALVDRAKELEQKL